MAHPDVTLDFASGASADASSFGTANPARWIAVYGAGNVVVVDYGGTTRTYPCLGGEIIGGEWITFTSTTCTRIRMTSTVLPPSFGPSLASLQPANLIQRYLSGGAALSAAFAAAIATVYLINPSGATFAYNLPAISASNDGQPIAVVNVSTGSTATVATPAGSDNVGNSAGTATGATAAGPTGGAVKVYVANNQTKAWLVGI